MLLRSTVLPQQSRQIPRSIDWKQSQRWDSENALRLSCTIKVKGSLFLFIILGPNVSLGITWKTDYTFWGNVQSNRVYNFYISIYKENPFYLNLTIKLTN